MAFTPIHIPTGSLPDSYLKSLLEAIRGSKVAHFKVLVMLSGCKLISQYSLSLKTLGTRLVPLLIKSNFPVGTM